MRIDYRWATPDDAKIRYSDPQKELVALQPDLILSNITPTTAAMLQQTHTIPIIFALVVDPILSGFVVGLPRPGGNATGFIALEGSMGYRGKSRGGMILRFPRGRESDSFWECRRLPMLTAFRTPT